MPEGFERLWEGGALFRQGEGAFKLSTDSVLLAHFVGKKQVKSFIDLGCGAGVLTLLLKSAMPKAYCAGIDIQPESAELCRENLRVNGYEDSGILTGDLREHRSLYRAESFGLVVSNPPYFAAGSGFTAPAESRAIARDERFCTLSDLCAAAKYLCRYGGYFCLVHRPERLSEIFVELTKNGLEPKRLRMVQHHEGSAPNLVLIEARRGAKPELSIEPPLIMTAPGGGDSAEIKEIYHR